MAWEWNVDKLLETTENVLTGSKTKYNAFKGILPDKFWYPAIADHSYYVRILPFMHNGQPNYTIPFGTHYFGGGTPGDYVCPRVMYNGECPICEYAFKLWREGEQDTAKKFFPKNSPLFWILDMENIKNGVLIWKAKFSIIEGFKQALKIPALGYPKMFDPEEGCNFLVLKTVDASKDKKTGTKYSISALKDTKGPIEYINWQVELQNMFIDKIEVLDYVALKTKFDATLSFMNKKSETEEDIPEFSQPVVTNQTKPITNNVTNTTPLPQQAETTFKKEVPPEAVNLKDSILSMLKGTK